jgi:hypothetical protein
MSRIFGPVRQVAYVVPDIDEAIDRWVKNGVGPFFRIDHPELDYLRFEGEDIKVDLSIAMAVSGGMQFELIQQHNDDPSPYRNFLVERGEGYHHLGTWSENYDADMARWLSLGFKPSLEGSIGGGRFTYFASPTLPGTYIEVGDITDWKGVMAQIEAASVDWDGADPVRSLAGLLEAGQ